MAPVAGDAEGAQLVQDRVTRFLLPLPDPFDKLFPPQLRAAGAALGQLAFDDVLRRDPGMIGPWHPQDAKAVHALVTAQDVLEGVIERMAHVQRSGNVGRWYDNRIALAGASSRREKLLLHPVPIPLGFNF